MKQIRTLGTLIFVLTPTPTNTKTLPTNSNKPIVTKSKITEKDKKEVIDLLNNIKKNSEIFTHKELLTRKISNQEMVWWKRALVSVDLYIDRHGDELLNRSFDLVSNVLKKFIETQQELYDLFQKDAPFEEGMQLLQELRISLKSVENNKNKLIKFRYVNSGRKFLQKMILNLKEVIIDAAHSLEQQYISSSLNRKKKEAKSCNSLFPLECK